MTAVGSFVTTIVWFVVVIGVLILIHELGHFFVARWTGVGVERFSIGFGPVLLRWRGAETEYCLSAFPLGGYVKMLGEENPLEGGGSMPYDRERAFAFKPLWARFLIVFAGPGMNFVLAAVIMIFVFAFVGRPVWTPFVGRVAPNSPAEAVGLKTGDEIVAVNGRRITYWEDLERAVSSSGGRPLELEVRRGDTVLRVTGTPRLVTVRDPLFKDAREVWDLGTGPRLTAQIESVGPNSPAAKAGLKPGDVVISAAGQPVYTPDDFVQTIRARPRQSFDVVVERDGKRLTLTVTPNAVKEKTLEGREIEVGRIEAAVVTKTIKTEPYSVPVAVERGVVWTANMTVVTVKGFWKFVSRQIDSSNLGGPILIATEAGRQAKEGLSQVALFTAVISVNLAVINLLPVPMLDGGHLLFFVIEAILGRPISLKKREAAQQLGFVLLMLVMFYAVYNDLVRVDFFNWFLRKIGAA